MNDLPDRLKAWREAAKLNQEEAAKVFYVSTSTYSKWEQGTRTPTWAAMMRIEAKVGAA